MDKEPKENGKQEKAKRPPTSDLSIATVIVVWGALFSTFPSYVGIQWDLVVGLFKFLGLTCYVIGFLGAIIGLTNLMNHIDEHIREFLKTFVMGSFFIIIAYLFHLGSLWFISAYYPFLVLRLFVLIFVGVGFLLFGVAMPNLFSKPFKGITLENTMRALLAIISISAALIPLLKSLI